MDKAIIRNGKIVYGQSAELQKPSETEAYRKREDMKVNHRKDLLQKNETAYYKAYPKQLDNLSDETKRLLS